MLLDRRRRRTWPVVLSICATWGVLATAIGEVTAGRRPAARSAGTARPSSTCRRARWRDDGPVYARPMREPADLDAAGRPTGPRRCPGRDAGDELRETAAAHGRLAEPVRQDLGHRAVRPVRAGQHRAGPAGGRRRDPHRRGRPASASRSRSTATAGTPGSTRTPGRSWRWPRRTATWPPPAPTPVAVTNCLNFGSPEDPGVMWQFAEAVRGLADGCQELGIPVTGGNVSFYNQTGATPIHPTPVVGVLGRARRRRPRGCRWASPSRATSIVPARRDPRGARRLGVGLGRRTGTSAARRRAVDLAARAAAGRGPGRGGPRRHAHRRARPLRRRPGAGAGRVPACAADVGARIRLPEEHDPFVALFSESTARAVVSVAEDDRIGWPSWPTRTGCRPWCSAR